MVKTTYLIKKDGQLVRGTYQEFKQITELNKDMLTENKRRFIRDEIREGDLIDRYFIEVSYEEYLKWHAEEEWKRRNSADVFEECLPLEEFAEVDGPFCLGSESLVLEESFYKGLIQKLEELGEWAKTACCCMMEGEENIPPILIKQYGLPRTTAFRYVKKLKLVLRQYYVENGVCY